MVNHMLHVVKLYKDTRAMISHMLYVVKLSKDTRVMICHKLYFVIVILKIITYN